MLPTWPPPYLGEKHDVTILAEAGQLPERFANLDVSFVRGSGADGQLW